MIRNNLHCSNAVLIYLQLLVLLHTFLAQDIGVYWGQNSHEGSLGETCATGKYSYVNIASLVISNQTPEINLGGHCDPYSNGCTYMSSDIRNCQKQGIKVMLSVTWADEFHPGIDYAYISTEFSAYLWNNFLGGKSPSRPFGNAILDGIDFAIPNNSVLWEDVASKIRLLLTLNIMKSIRLSAAPLCSFDNSENSTLNNGTFDYLWVQFNSPQCEYKEGNIDNLINSWNQWTKSKVRKILLGLPPSKDAGSGYIPVNVLNSQILPVIRKSPKYGGIMLSSRYFDRVSAYSDSIINPLCRVQNPTQCSDHDIYFKEEFGFMSMAGFKVNESEVISHHCCEVMCRNNCSCTAYAPTNYTTNNGCKVWSKGSTFYRSSLSNGHKIYVAVKGIQEPTPDDTRKHHSVNLVLKWIIIAVMGALAIIFICYLSCAIWRKYKEEVDSRKKQQKLIHDIGGDAMVTIMYSKANKSKKQAKTNDEVEIFSFESMVAATNYFSASNKLGEGGFGTVYMGRLTYDQEIAIKRLSTNSGQGLREFKNEAKLIAKLQHTNLVRLLGLCIERDERILVYEYMSNRSLDFHLFDVARKDVLDWQKRLNIIEGIAQGLLYLHKYSRVKVIHCDLKASNILLDDKMNPKISDFGMARIVGLKGFEEKTNRIVGTHGYMSPEYILNGIISIKTDVFSFGVLLLEIIGGKKNRCCYHSDLPLNLTGYAWQLWNEGRTLELIDPGLNETCTPNEVLRCFHIGLLCVQDQAIDRPTMLEVVSFLSNHAIQLAQPKQPAFFINVDRYKSKLPSSKQENCSINYVTLSDLEGR